MRGFGTQSAVAHLLPKAICASSATQAAGHQRNQGGCGHPVSVAVASKDRFDVGS